MRPGEKARNNKELKWGFDKMEAGSKLNVNEGNRPGNSREAPTGGIYLSPPSNKNWSLSLRATSISKGASNSLAAGENGVSAVGQECFNSSELEHLIGCQRQVDSQNAIFFYFRWSL